MLTQPPSESSICCFLFSNSVGGLGKSSSRFHAHFSSKDPSWPCSDKLADKMDGARRLIFQNLCKHICIYLSLHLFIIFVIHTFLVHFMSSSWPNEWSALWFFHAISVRETTSWSDLWFKWLKNKRSLMEWGYASMFAPRMGKISTPESLAIFFASSANSPRQVAACLSWGNRISRSTC